MVENIRGNEACDVVRLEELDQAVPDEEDHDPVRFVRGKVLADCLADLLDAHEQAATRKWVVAFSLAGSSTISPTTPEWLQTYINLADSGCQRVPRAVAPHRTPQGQVRIADLN